MPLSVNDVWAGGRTDSCAGERADSCAGGRTAVRAVGQLFGRADSCAGGLTAVRAADGQLCGRAGRRTEGATACCRAGGWAGRRANGPSDRYLSNIAFNDNLISTFVAKSGQRRRAHRPYLVEHTQVRRRTWPIPPGPLLWP